MPVKRRGTLPAELKAMIDGLSLDRIASAIAAFTIARRTPRPQNLAMLNWEELTVKAHRNQKQAAQEVFKRCMLAHVPRDRAQQSATYAAAKVGELYYKARKSPHVNDHTVRGFFKPPEWREEQRLEGIAAAKAERERLAQPARPAVRRRPGGQKP